jgi:hypothetical protein
MRLRTFGQQIRKFSEKYGGDHRFFIHWLVSCDIYGTTKPVLKKPDFAATFFFERVEGSMRRLVDNTPTPRGVRYGSDSNGTH